MTYGDIKTLYFFKMNWTAKTKLILIVKQLLPASYRVQDL